MTPLDLTQRPPRSPYDRLGGLLFLARTIDKARATLPGGNLGAYQIKGFSVRMFEALGIDETDFASMVALAANDDDVVAWVLKHTTPEQRDRSNEILLSLRVKDRIDQEGWLERYPVAKTMPLDAPLLELLDADDRASFASAPLP